MATTKISDLIQRYIHQGKVGQEPVLLIDGNIVVANFQRFAKALPNVLNYYAVKANPHPEILRTLVQMGSYFDCASVTEINAVIAAGAAADRISYGNTNKSDHDILAAYNLGVRMFATDSLSDVGAIAKNAPGSDVFCRFICRGEGFAKPYSNKFGCDEPTALKVLEAAKDAGLIPRGVSFHVGTQKLDIQAWPAALAIAARLFDQMAQKGVTMDLLNLGGGFPTNYVANQPIPDIDDYGAAIKAALNKHFRNKQITTIIEPGRGMVGNAGVLVARVINTSRCSEDEPLRAILNVGTYHGLRETKPDAFRPFVSTMSSDHETTQYQLFGPSCDSTDYICEGQTFMLPQSLAREHIVLFHASGAYTMGYSTSFNGMAPPTCKVLWE